MQLEKNKKYEATISLTGMEVFATNKMIEKKLTDAGFKDVTVTGSGSVRNAIGTWAQPTKSNVELPKQVSSIK